MSNEISGPTSSQVGNIYKDQANLYAEFAANSFSWKYIEERALDDQLLGLLRPGLKTLDAGSGSGRIIQYLIERGVNPKNITGIDISPEILKIARERLPGVNLVQANLSEAKLPQGEFELVTSSMVFHYIDNVRLEWVFRNFYNWLKQTGVLVYVVNHPMRNVSGDLENYQRRGWRMEKTPWGTKIPFFHRTVADYLNLTINAGFEIEAVDEPRILEEGKLTDPVEYQRYHSYGAARLAVKAVKK